jgi:glycerol-3-phosphate cytidylyltransferase
MEIKKGFVASSFDIMHPGYTLMLKECKDNCNYLIAALHQNPKSERSDKNHPVMSLTERFIVLKSIRYIDELAVYESEKDLKNLLRLYRPDVRFLGDEYKELSPLKITGYIFCRNIHYINRTHGYSSSGLRERIYEAEKKKENLEKFKCEERRYYSSYYE